MDEGKRALALAGILLLISWAVGSCILAFVHILVGG